MHRQKQILGYGVMVTLQMLVLSFLVRIQVAQLKRLSFEGRFFVVMLFAWGGVPPLLRCYLFADASIATNNTTALQSSSHANIIPPLNVVLALCRLILTLCWLSRYDRGLLLDLSVCAFFCKVSALFCKQNSNPGSPTKTTLIRGSFFCVYVGVVVCSTQGVHVVLDYYAPMQALCKLPNSPQPKAVHTTTQPHPRFILSF